jgi:hypothetical protein
VDTSGNCGGSYSVVVVSPDFRKKMTLARHKLGKWIHGIDQQRRTARPVVVQVVVEAGCASDQGYVSRGIPRDIKGRRMGRKPSTSARNAGRWEPLRQSVPYWSLIARRTWTESQSKKPPRLTSSQSDSGG